MANEGVRQPDRRKRERGTFRSDRSRPGAPSPTAAKGLRPPTWLDVIGRREWRRVAPELERLDLLADIHQTLLAGYCQAVSKAVSAEGVLASEGRYYSTTTAQGDTMRRRHPAVADAEEGWRLVKLLADRLGITNKPETDGPKENDRKAIFK